MPRVGTHSSRGRRSIASRQRIRIKNPEDHRLEEFWDERWLQKVEGTPSSVLLSVDCIQKRDPEQQLPHRTKTPLIAEQPKRGRGQNRAAGKKEKSRSNQPATKKPSPSDVASRKETALRPKLHIPAPTQQDLDRPCTHREREGGRWREEGREIEWRRHSLKRDHHRALTRYCAWPAASGTARNRRISRFCVGSSSILSLCLSSPSAPLGEGTESSSRWGLVGCPVPLPLVYADSAGARSLCLSLSFRALSHSRCVTLCLPPCPVSLRQLAQPQQQQQQR